MSEPATPQDHSSIENRGAFCSLKHRNYSYYFFAQLLSLTGSWTQTTALMWLSYSADQQSIWPSLIAALQVLPGFFLGPLGGRLADKYPRKKLILITQVMFSLQSLGLFLAVYSGFTSPIILLSFSLLWGVINAIDLPARLTFLVEMVGMRDLFNAVALNSLQFNLARLAGPAIGALLLSNLGPEACFLANTFSYMILILALGLMNQSTMFQEPAIRNNASLTEGFKFILARSDLVLVISIAGGMALLGWPLLALLPGFVEKELALGHEAYGTLLSGVGGGALSSALLLAIFGNNAPKGITQALGMMLAGAGLFTLGISKTMFFALPCSILFGAGMILFFATSQGLVQLGAGNTHRGLVLGVWSMMLCSMVPLGNFLAGPLADLTSVRHVMLSQAILIWILLLLFVIVKTRQATNPAPKVK